MKSMSNRDLGRRRHFRGYAVRNSRICDELVDLGISALEAIESGVRS
jgi:hypothetical protein